MILNLINALALLLSLSLLHGFIVRFSYKNKRSKQVLSAIVFGGICVVGMERHPTGFIVSGVLNFGCVFFGCYVRSKSLLTQRKELASLVDKKRIPIYSI